MGTRVVLPDDLIQEIDRVAGAQKRGAFIEEAVRERLRREAVSAALEATAGSLRAEDYPEWDSPEAVSRWVRNLRRQDEARLARKLGTNAD